LVSQARIFLSVMSLDMIPGIGRQAAIRHEPGRL
jgi:hypothetical protein